MVSPEVSVEPRMIAWAVRRSGREEAKLEETFKKLPMWLRGERSPTLRQLEKLANATRTPFGAFFLPEPLEDTLPVADFRTVADRLVDQPSVDLLDVLARCQQRQAWYRDHARATGQPRRAWVGSADTRLAPEAAAERIRATLGWSIEERAAASTWEDALRRMMRSADAAGVLVMRSGVVDSNPNRPLDPDEFRGFALPDPWAPLVFLNGQDSLAAMSFTLAHEAAHLWLGEGGVSGAVLSPESAGPGAPATERWCNRVAAEVLMPREELLAELVPDAPLDTTVAAAARRFKVSALVVLRGLLDAGWLDETRFWQAFQEERSRLAAVLARQREHEGGGGNFYATAAVRAGHRFTKAVAADAVAGGTPWTDAFRMLGVNKPETLRRLAGYVDGKTEAAS